MRRLHPNHTWADTDCLGQSSHALDIFALSRAWIEIALRVRSNGLVECARTKYISVMISAEVISVWRTAVICESVRTTPQCLFKASRTTHTALVLHIPGTEQHNTSLKVSLTWDLRKIHPLKGSVIPNEWAWKLHTGSVELFWTEGKKCVGGTRGLASWHLSLDRSTLVRS